MPEGYKPLYTEYGDGTCERRFVVSTGSMASNIAVLKNGVLRLTKPMAGSRAALVVANGLELPREYELLNERLGRAKPSIHPDMAGPVLG
ncbi:MAG: hypothetical protein ACTHOR_18255 [Devosia sp.]